MTDLKQKLLDAGYPEDMMFHYYSDLYVFANPITKYIINEWCHENGLHRHLFVSTFTDQLTGQLMYDIAFQWHE